MKTAVIVVLAFAVGALAAPYNNPSPYPATTYKQPYNSNSYQSNDYNGYQNNDYNSYDTSYNQPAYNDYGKSSYSNDYSPSYKQPAYSDYSQSYPQPNYNDYGSTYKQPAYNDYSSSYKQPDYSSSYKQPDYSSSYKQPAYTAPSYQSNSYGYSKPCAPLTPGYQLSLKTWGKKIAYVADDEVTEAYCGDKFDGKDNVFYVKSGQKCVVIDERGVGLEESLTFSCNHQTGYWDLLAGSDTKYQAISQYDIVCADKDAGTPGCAVAAGTKTDDNTESDLSWFYPYNYNRNGY